MWPRIKKIIKHVHPVNLQYNQSIIEMVDLLCLSAPVPGPLNLRSSDVNTNSFQVSWDHSANDIVLYRLSWAPFTGGNTKEVSAVEVSFMAMKLLELWQADV